MKKFLMCLCAMMLVFGMVGSASAISFTDTQTLNKWLGGENQDDSGTYTWTHNTPANFEVPYDVVNSATLEVSASYVNAYNEKISVEGIYQGKLRDLTWSWVKKQGAQGSTEFDIADIFTTWNAGDSLNVTLAYREVPRYNELLLESSTFTLNYDNASAPVPEPSTILLMGAGLLGLAGYNRKRLNKKS